MFGDSSQDLPGTVEFLRGYVTTDNRTSTELAFIFGEDIVAPKKALTIPKLELQSSLLAARLRKDIKTALTIKIDTIFLWTDSTTGLH